MLLLATVQGYRRMVEVGIGDHIILHATGDDLDRLEAVNARILEAQGVDEAALRLCLARVAGDAAENRTLRTSYSLLQPVIPHEGAGDSPRTWALRRVRERGGERRDAG